MALEITESDLSDWMAKLGPRLLAVARGICRDADAAEDIVQEAFVRLWRSPPDGPEAVVPSWMRRVVVNLSINHIRRTKRVEAMPEFSTDPALRNDARPEEALELSENLLRVERGLDALPVDKRAILLMKVREGMSYQEIADAMDIPIGTVMSRLNRARAALMEAIEKDLIDADADPLIFPTRKAQG